MRLLLASVAFVALAAVGAAFLTMSRKAPPDARVEAELAGVKFSYARAYARDEATGAGGLTDRLAFIASFPAFAPISARDRASPRTVALTVTPRDDSLDPSERPAKLYARFLTPETRDGPAGLVRRNFESGSPFDFEDLFIAPPEGRGFFARCLRTQGGAAGAACLSMFREGAVDVELRYPAAFLEHWDALYDGARGLLARMRSRRPRSDKR